MLNDNGRSYAPTVGGLSHHLSELRGRGSADSPGARPSGSGGADLARPGSLFCDLGLTYIGPVDGHDIAALTEALTQARACGAPVVVHVVTVKGCGYRPAEDDEVDHFHSVGVRDPRTGLPLPAPGISWTTVFSEEMVAIGRRRPDVVAITAAMLQPIGLQPFASAFPDRIFDVGIAEQHAVTSAAGLAMGGMHPVVAVYATFLNRAFDQVLMDVALHRSAVTFVLNNAGITGPDGASHHGMWDLAMLNLVPRLRIAAPRDGGRLRELLAEAVEVSDAPTVVRYPKGDLGFDIPTQSHAEGLDVIFSRGAADVLLVSVGALAPMCLRIADSLSAEGIGVRVVDPRWVKPIDGGLIRLASAHRLVVTVEDGILSGGVGAHIAGALREAGVDTPLRDFGIAGRFLDHGTRQEVLASVGLSADSITSAVIKTISCLSADSNKYPPVPAR